MFKIVPNPTFTSQVLLSRPDSDSPIAVQVTWLHKGAHDLAKWLASATERDSDADFLDEVVKGWSGFVAEDGAPLPYSKEALAVLLAQFPSSGPELVQAYRRRLADARAKN